MQRAEQVQEGFQLGGGEEPSSAWGPGYHVDYGHVDYEDGWKTVLKGGKVMAKPREVYGVTPDGAWERITFVGDSGAVNHILMKDVAKGFGLRETPMSKAGIGFGATNGTKIQNYGEKALGGVTNEGDPFRMKCQVTDAKRNLASLPKMVEEGNGIWLSKKGSYIQNKKSGLKVPMRLKAGETPEFDLFVKRAKVTGQFGVLNVDGEADIKDSAVSVFQRLEQLI